MIISDSSASSRIRARNVIILSSAVLAAIALVVFISRKGGNKKQRVDYQTPELEAYTILCDAEEMRNDTFFTGEHFFLNGHTQSDSFSLSGNYSCMLKESNGLQFGMTYRLTQFQPGDLFKLSVWRYRPSGGNGLLVVNAHNGPEFYIEENYPTNINDEGWEKLEYFITAPDKTEALVVYVYSGGDAPVFFDDLKIEKMVNENMYQAQVLNIQLKDKHLRKIQQKRADALKAGILESSDNDWVKAKINNPNSNDLIPVELRLKGDWLDHLKGDKWSFRIKVKDPYAWNRLKTFSVQTPAAREYLREWILHKLWEREDVLTTRYEFIKLSLNGDSKGIYVYEEHFEKQLVEYKNRREGPIVRFAEDGFWAAIKRQLEHVGSGINYSLPQPEKDKENALIRPFKESQTAKNPVLSQQFEAAQQLMQQYVDGNFKAEDIFDTDLLAKYFAICDVMGAYHGMVWHNQRFYYNPVTSKLEPVGFDGFPLIDRFYSSFIGDGALNKEFRTSTELYEPLFQQEEFFTTYIQYLYRFTSLDYIMPFFDEIRPELEKRLNMLKMEFPFYKFSEVEILKRAQRIHAVLLPLPDVSIRAFRQNPQETKGQLKLSNLHGTPIEILGTGLKKKTMDYELEEPILLPSYQNKFLDNKYTNFELGQAANYVFYRTLGLDSIFSTPIINWKIPEGLTVRQQLFDESPIKSNNVFTVTDSLIYFPAGQQTITEDIILPKGYTIDFAAGANLDFINGAKFISYSPLIMKGTDEQSIIIKSSDGSAGGFTSLTSR